MSDNTEKASVLIVDDDATSLRYLMDILKDSYKPYIANTGEMALALLKTRKPDLIILDIEMPRMDGYEVMRNIKGSSELRDIPVVFLTGLEDRSKEQEALDLGASDYILKPITAGIVKARVGHHIELSSYRKKLEQLVEKRTSQLQQTQDGIMDMLANMTSFRDSETGAHIKRTTAYAKALTEHLLAINHPDYSINREYATGIIRTAKLHDIGKVAVPDNILLKPDRLTDMEFAQIKLHPLHGAQILDAAFIEMGGATFFLTVGREIIISHHEKWDGSGYPYGLKGANIPISGRIMAIADVYDALISRRPYKPAFNHEKARNILLRDAGTHFDPRLVDLSVDVIARFDEMARIHRDENI